MSGWVRGQFEQHHTATGLDAPPRGRLEEYSQHVLAECGRPQMDDVSEVTAAREAMCSAAGALLEFASRDRPRRTRYAPAASVPKPSTTSIRNRTIAIRDRYRRR
jgi:hypothetical protein